ncbi:MAG: ABC transporter permease, partial [Rubrobacter sp.]|nr:ABC transporter permease [Rubrobacter sp.]
MRLRSFSGLSLRSLGARPQRTLLTVVGIVLGVAIVMAVLTLSGSMSSTFTDLFSRAYGAADLTVTAAGGSGPVDETVVEEIRADPEVASAAPRLSRAASLVLDGVSEDGVPEVESLRLFGVQPETADLATGFDLEEGRLPESGAEIALDSGAAESAGLSPGDEVRIAAPGGVVELRLVGTLQIPGGSFGGSAFGMAPLPFVQEAFERPNEVS